MMKQCSELILDPMQNNICMQDITRHMLILGDSNQRHDYIIDLISNNPPLYMHGGIVLTQDPTFASAVHDILKKIRSDADMIILKSKQDVSNLQEDLCAESCVVLLIESDIISDMRDMMSHIGARLADIVFARDKFSVQLTDQYFPIIFDELAPDAQTISDLLASARVYNAPIIVSINNDTFEQQSTIARAALRQNTLIKVSYYRYIEKDMYIKNQLPEISVWSKPLLQYGLSFDDLRVVA